MATVMKTISLPHGTIPTQMFGNVNLQNAMMYVNENFTEVKNSINESATAVNEALSKKADSDHDHDDKYAELKHTHGQSEITGLSSALDGKAELNHEHTQYLSSLPAHYHSTSDIGGLDERLQQKAEKTHSHAISQIDGLTSEIGLKASTAYVDQQINSVGSSIKTIADAEIVSYGASAGSESTEGDVPKDVVSKPESETIPQKNARVGSSSRWARADHKHVFSADIGSSPTEIGVEPGEESPFPGGTGQGAGTLWTAGGDNGAHLYLLYKDESSSVDEALMECRITISKIGTITKIEAVEDGGLVIVT